MGRVAAGQYICVNLDLQCKFTHEKCKILACYINVLCPGARTYPVASQCQTKGLQLEMLLLTNPSYSLMLLNTSFSQTVQEQSQSLPAVSPDNVSAAIGS